MARGQGRLWIKWAKEFSCLSIHLDGESTEQHRWRKNSVKVEASELQMPLNILLIIGVNEDFLFKHTGTTNFGEMPPPDAIQKD